MVLEVDEEPLPAGWEVVMSRSKNMPYYYHAKSQKVYWVDDELPRGWAHQFDAEGRRFYFHIGRKTDSTSYDKPVLRAPHSSYTRQRDRSASPPEPAPLPAASYGRSTGGSRRYEDDDPRDRGHTNKDYDNGPPPQSSQPAKLKGNSLTDLLSPAVDDAHDPYDHSTSSSTSMSISNLVSSSSSSSSYNKRPFDRITQDADPNAAADFYNKLKRNATADRAESLLFHMRSMNNWVKSILINEYSKRDDRVLDLACGKGGDLMKWAKRGIRQYVGVDIAQKSLEDAVDRIQSNVQHRDLEVQFVQGDLGKVSLLEDELHCWTRERGWHDAVPMSNGGNWFQIVSMQFSFHYMFGDEDRAQRFFRTLHSVLVDGGIFIATTVDPNKVLHKYYQNVHAAKKPGDPDVRIEDEQKREVCTIRFDDSSREALSGYNASASGAFGLRYNFTLRDTDEESGGDKAVDLPEYLVPDDLLVQLLKENGFELLLQQNFHPFITKNLDRNRSLLEKMHVLNYAGTLSDAEWEIAGLYQVLAFKKAY